MTRTTISRRIDAPVRTVFEVVSNPNMFSEAVPGIVSVEVLSEATQGVGTRFRETRVMYGKQASTEIEITELVNDQRVRLVSDTSGTIWDTVFQVSAEGVGTALTMVMEAKPHKLVSKMLTPLMKRAVQKEIEKDMDAVKAFCEARQ